MREDSIKKIREACYKLVYQWKRKYKLYLEKGGEFPKPISIPMIAERAGLAPKTIYVDDKYRSIVEINIAKTKMCNKEEDIEFYIDKSTFTKDEVKLIVKDIKIKSEEKVKSLEKVLMKDRNKLISIEMQNKELSEKVDIFMQRIIELEAENEFLRDKKAL